MNHIGQLLPEANILLDLEATSKKRLFEQVGALFEEHAQIARAVVFDSLFAREKLGSTGLGQGIALPHGPKKGAGDAPRAFGAPGPADTVRCARRQAGHAGVRASRSGAGDRGTSAASFRAGGNVQRALISRPFVDRKGSGKPARALCELEG